MIAIHYPSTDFQIRTATGGREQIFDAIRKKWLVLTPEEWVRQNFVQYLIQVKQYPASLIALEKEIVLGELKKRFDILIYNRDHQPLMMIECKGADIAMNETVLQQVLRYNISVPVQYIVITNGSHTYGWHRNDKGLETMTEIPAWY